ncbi:MAG: thioredoxin family protein [Crocinitomicaceae bacterium]|jgi:thiol-disulfide isomerase/thioredoxin|nr:thioredoxin family protein [Crocinitomicaceae bacterium]MDP4867169.1 thioredoxin family protein [Crocinitomicaceae bacterium]MDP5011493.1 thioredoxin family protein [Crocinitomicaceae bacterium]
MKELEADILEQIVAGNSKVMVQYGATWCGNCKLTKPKFKKLASENEGIEFVYVDAEKFPNSRKLAEVNNLPTFAGFVNGQLVKQAQGNKIEVIEEVLHEVTNN